METEPARRGCMVIGRTGRFKVAGTVIGGAVVDVDARIVGAWLVVRGSVSYILSSGLKSGGVGKDAYNCMTLSGVGDGVERTDSRTERSGSVHVLELDVSARDASNIFASRTIG